MCLCSLTLIISTIWLCCLYHDKVQLRKCTIHSHCSQYKHVVNFVQVLFYSILSSQLAVDEAALDVSGSFSVTALLLSDLRINIITLTQAYIAPGSRRTSITPSSTSTIRIINLIS